MMEKNKKITDYFDRTLAILLAEKIHPFYKDFNSSVFIEAVDTGVLNKSYTQRISFIAEQLFEHLPKDYKKAIKILLATLGDENPNETGMFTHYYWVMPISKYIEIYGIEHFEISMDAIAEVTKRNTGEYAIRPFIRRYSEESLRQMKLWAQSDNFHLRRLASEGLRPKLPWAPKLDTFIEQPEAVFNILDLLKEDPTMFVKKSVGNHMTDWLKVNPEPSKVILNEWLQSENKHTQWIVKRATRKIKL